MIPTALPDPSAFIDGYNVGRHRYHGSVLLPDLPDRIPGNSWQYIITSAWKVQRPHETGILSLFVPVRHGRKAVQGSVWPMKQSGK
jgi:hypothetical protein